MDQSTALNPDTVRIVWDMLLNDGATEGQATRIISMMVHVLDPPENGMEMVALPRGRGKTDTVVKIADRHGDVVLCATEGWANEVRGMRNSTVSVLRTVGIGRRRIGFENVPMVVDDLVFTCRHGTLPPNRRVRAVSLNLDLSVDGASVINEILVDRRGRY